MKLANVDGRARCRAARTAASTSSRPPTARPDPTRTRSTPTGTGSAPGPTRLHPGDILFTGTPAGVGVGRSPRRFLPPGEELVSWIEGLGEMRQTFVADDRTTTSETEA